MLAVMTGWVWFRARDFDQAVAFFGSLVGRHGWNGLDLLTHIALNPSTLATLAIGGILALGRLDLKRLLNVLPRPVVVPVYATTDTLVIFLFFGFSVLSIAAGSYSPFLYFRF
jgi:hypothetical protein